MPAALEVISSSSGGGKLLVTLPAFFEDILLEGGADPGRPARE